MGNCSEEGVCKLEGEVSFVVGWEGGGRKCPPRLLIASLKNKMK